MAKLYQREQEWKFQDTLNGVMCSLLANINRSPNTTAYKAEDFYIMREAEMKKTPEQLVAIMNQWAAVKNG